MGVLSLFRGVYDLDTLDTRFTNPSSIPYKTVVEARDDALADRDPAARGPQPPPSPRWHTPEFYLYYLVFVLVVPYMFWVAYDVSRPEDPNYKSYEHLLSPGWIPGRKIDTSDAQYRTFRQNLPYMAALLVLHPLLRRLYNAVAYPVAVSPRGPPPQSGSPRLSPAEEADRRLDQRASFDFSFALFYLAALHGFSALKVLAILGANYRLATALPRRAVPPATWVFNIGILFANELCRGYRFASAAALVSAPASLVDWGRWLDAHGGLMGRWEILFNITVLRLISFNLDYYWSLDRRSHSPVEKQLDPSSLSERDRVSVPARARDYSFRNYVAYAVYAPLYLTGPIITYNDFVSQLRHRPASIERGRTLRYAARFALALLACELVLHYDYVQAISQSRPRWARYTPAQLSLLSYFNLTLIWLKLLLPWRLFRLWSLLDGVDPPENMIRCVSDNWSALAFWRSWHRSFYRWSLRYIYVPLRTSSSSSGSRGGSGSGFGSARETARSVLTYVLVFTFVALWHDIQLRLLVWGWLVVLFMLPEMAAGWLVPARGGWARRRPGAYRLASCVGAVGNVLMMMAANLVGFAVGVEGLQAILAGIFGNVSGYVFMICACAALFTGVQVMFEVRESEIRRGINLKC
ncbi:MBOAT-domain-containing protein [Xylariaceae sp. FL0804]|nr:MBOAT-domain-containing protein [Xylariaceae sp. FL0804]